MRDCFIVYRSFLEALAHLNDEQRLKCYEAYHAYAMNGTLPEGGVELAIIKGLAPVIDRTNRNYETKVENGRKGGLAKAKRGEALADSKQTQADIYIKEKDKEKEKDKDKDKDKYFQRPRRGINNYSHRHSGESQEDRSAIEAARLSELLEKARTGGVDI